MPTEHPHGSPAPAGLTADDRGPVPAAPAGGTHTFPADPADQTRSHPGPGGATRTGPPDDPQLHLDTVVQLPGGGAPRAVSVVPGYEIIAELGRGGMGVVYKARQVKADRTVALKMILSGGHASAGELTRFRTEAEAAARLQHPNVIQVFEVGEYSGLPFFSMEYCDGGSLSRKLGGTPLTPRESASLVAELAGAAHAAHLQGVVHRDLKPGNVILTADGVPKITDFGIARKLDSDAQHTRSGALLGTPSYMAPEQAAGDRRIGPAVDVYALGAILYECLTGRPPFKGPTTWDTVSQVLRDDPASPRLLNPAIPPDLETVCLKCLQKEPARRYADARGLAEDLERFLEGRPVKARPVGRPVRAWRWCRRNPALAASLAAAALATVAALGLLAGLAAYQTEVGHDLLRKQQAVGAALAQKEEALRQAESSHKDSRKQYAMLALDRGLTLCEDGDAARGMLFLVAALDYAAQTGDPKLQRFIRSNIGAWRRQLVPLTSMIPDHGPHGTLAVKPDGRTVAAVAPDGGIQQWDVGSGHRVGPAIKPPAGVERLPHMITYDPGGTLLLVADADRRVRVYEARSGQPVGQPLAHKNLLSAMTFSPDGGILATACDDLVQLWDAKTWQPIGSPVRRGQQVLSVQFDPAGGRVMAVVGATAENQPKGEVWLWEPVANPHRIRLAAGENVTRATFLPGAPAVLTVSWDERKGESRVRAWSLETGDELGRQWVGKERITLAVPSNGKTVAVAQGNSVSLWSVNLRDGNRPCLVGPGPTGPTVLNHLAPVTSVSFSPDGSAVVTGGQDGVAQLWDAEGRRLGESMDHQGLVLGATFIRSGSAVLTQCDDLLIRVWDARLGLPPAAAWNGVRDEDLYAPFESRQPDSAFTLTPDRRAVVHIDHRKFPAVLRLYDTATGEPIGDGVPHQGDLRQVAFGGDKYLIHVTKDGAARVLELATGRVVGKLLGDERGVERVALSPDGRTAVTADRAGARRWDVATGQPVGGRFGQASAVRCLAFTPDGQHLLTGHADGSVTLWRGGGVVLRGGLEEVRSLHASPSGGKLLVVGTASGGGPGLRPRVVARLWDLAAAAPVGGVIAQDGDVLAAEFGPDGAVFATGGGDEKRGTGEARLWDAATGAPLGPPLVHQERVVAVAFGPDGLLATGSTDRTARLWDVATGRAVGPAVPIFRDPKAVEAVGFTPDGSRLLLAGANGVQTWPVPRPVDADLGRIRLWAEVIGGKSLDTGGSTRVLGSGEWWDRRRALDEHGNAPAADPVMIAPLFERRKRFRELQPRHFPVGLAGG